MHDDQTIWNALAEKGGFCSFKMATETGNLCRNANNVSGYCNRESCPLANSKYATVREVKGRLFLFLKEPERVHKPRQTYEKIRLSTNYTKALAQVDKELKLWSKWTLHKCKQRLTKLTEYLERKEELDEVGRPIYVKRDRRAERRDRKTEKKVISATNIEKTIEQEILERYRSGLYGPKVLLEQEIKDKETIEREKRFRRQLNGVKYVVDFEDEEREEEREVEKREGERREKEKVYEW